MTSTPFKANLSDVYTALSENPGNDSLWRKHLWEGPAQTDIANWQAQGYSVYQGKVRTMLDRDGRVQMLHSDRLTAFDRMISCIPGKGALLTAISKWWFQQLSSRDIPTHFIDSPGPRVILAEACSPIKVEVVVRAYLAGSMLRAYQKGERMFCGVVLPEGLKPYERLPEPIITPTTKAAAFEHDENVTVDQLIRSGLCSVSVWDEISKLALRVFSIGSRLYGERGWILVDTKYEFGKSKSGQIKLIDEVHTPDCSRLWVQNSYQERWANNQPPEMLDKENVRRWLVSQGFAGTGPVPVVPRDVLVELGRTYLKVAETLTGSPVYV
jgi:phosphoribosylaminoimidazole-succinocarboxamide synthase